MNLSKTISREDLERVEVAAQARSLKQFAWKMFLRGDGFAVNGISKWRWRIRWNKLWEYARGLSYVPWEKGWKVMDFGGGATLPVYYLADQGLEVFSYDIDAKLTGEAQALAKKRNWPLNATTRDLTKESLDVKELFDWVMSFCVLEHLPRQNQLEVIRLMGDSLKIGGYMTITFDYSPEAPVTDALRSLEDVKELVKSSGLKPLDGQLFSDTGERFVLDKKYPDSKFTFGSLFLKKE